MANSRKDNGNPPTHATSQFRGSSAAYIKERSKIRMGCWNVRSLNNGKMEEIEREMEEKELSFIGLSETRMKGKGEERTENGHKLVYSR